MRAPYTIFKKTKNVEVVTYTNGKLDTPAKRAWQKELWVERGEDMYALMSPGYRNVTVRIIERDEWLRSPLVEEIK